MHAFPSNKPIFRPLSASLRDLVIRILCARRYKKTIFEKSIFCPKIQFWPKTPKTQTFSPNFSREIKVDNSWKAENHNIFTSFPPKIFLTIFLVKWKLSSAKKSKTTIFSRVFHPKKIDNFLVKSKLNFWTKKWRFRTVWIILNYLNYISFFFLGPISVLMQQQILRLLRPPKALPLVQKQVTSPSARSRNCWRNQHQELWP